MLKDIDLFHFPRNSGVKYSKKLTVTARKTEVDPPKSDSTIILQKTAETKGDSVGDKIGNKVSSEGKRKSKQMEGERD